MEELDQAGSKTLPTSNSLMAYAEIVVNTPLAGPTPPAQSFTYSIPESLADSVAPGQLVWVPFGTRRVQGMVVRLSDTSPVAETRPITALVDERPFLTPLQIDLARWIAGTYFCPLNDALQLMLPAGVEQKIEVFLSLDPAAPCDHLTPKQQELANLLAADPVKLNQVPRPLRSAVDALARRGILIKQSVLVPPRAQPKHAVAVRLVAADRVRFLTPRAQAQQADVLETLASRAEEGAIAADELRQRLSCSQATLDALAKKDWIEIERGRPGSVRLKLTRDEAREHADTLRQNPRYAPIVDFLSQEANPVWISAVYAATGCSRQDLVKLESAGVVALETEEVWRDSLAQRTFEVVEPPKLTPGQETALNAIVASIGKEHRTFLLHGVTGSGKTEIYLRALAEVLAQGKQAIVLVPEIALTPQTIRRFGARFPRRLAVLHSHLSVGERYDTWRRCRDGVVDIVVGSRSALFAPLPRLGMIVMDEEHEPAYKQDTTPHYHARAVALELARRASAVVVLGTATPDLETYYRARRGTYTLLELPQRIMGHAQVIAAEAELSALPQDKLAVHPVAPEFAEARYLDLPRVEIVDLRAELKAGNRSIFSRALQREMEGALAAREQIILFLNRRGNATFVLCRDCGMVFKCRRCDNPMTYHGSGDLLRPSDATNQLVCHHCNRRDRMPTHCKDCSSPRIRYFGAGTQKVEEELASLFPQARALRWDWDVTRGKDAHEAILDQFIHQRADVLVGTQMLAKGLDLPRVTLVGIVSADTSLNLPDFRAGERTFQLLTQVAGRAGRSLLGGKVILQTYNPDHYAVQAASRHAYGEFYEREIAFRRENKYPPFSRLIRLVYVNPSEKKCQAETERMQRDLELRIKQRGLPALDLIGPAPAFFHRVRGEYRYHIILRGREPRALLEDLILPLGWRVDVDPVSVL